MCTSSNSGVPNVSYKDSFCSYFFCKISYLRNVFRCTQMPIELLWVQRVDKDSAKWLWTQYGDKCTTLIYSMHINYSQMQPSHFLSWILFSQYINIWHFDAWIQLTWSFSVVEIHPCTSPSLPGEGSKPQNKWPWCTVCGIKSSSVAEHGIQNCLSEC